MKMYLLGAASPETIRGVRAVQHWTSNLGRDSANLNYAISGKSKYDAGGK